MAWGTPGWSRGPGKYQEHLPSTFLPAPQVILRSREVKRGQNNYQIIVCEYQRKKILSIKKCFSPSVKWWPSTSIAFWVTWPGGSILWWPPESAWPGGVSVRPHPSPSLSIISDLWSGKRHSCWDNWGSVHQLDNQVKTLLRFRLLLKADSIDREHCMHIAT